MATKRNRSSTKRASSNPVAAPATGAATRRWLVYLLRCRDGSLYTGITNDLPRRLESHAAGRASRYTRSRLPVTLAYEEPQRSKSHALKREAAIKRLPRGQKDLLISPRPPDRARKPPG
ncbi:MAG: GIY-YIG nuclease family protein [Planctomycetia bacterium]